PAADRDRAGTDVGIIRLPLKPNLIAPGSTLVRLPPADAGVQLDGSAAAAAGIGQNESGAAAKVHSAAMTPGRIREQHVDAGGKQISRGPAQGVDVGGDLP